MNPTTTLTAKDIQKPKRPLSAFNLFYRYKRQHIIRLLSSPSNSNGSVNEDAVRCLIETAPGLEEYYNTSSATGYDAAAASASTQAEEDALRRHRICFELKNLQARDLKTRAHRTSMNCPIGFVELSKLMNSNWKACDDVGKAVFNEISQEIREVYRRQVKEYNDLCKALGITKQKQTKKTSKKKKRDDETSNSSDEPVKKMKPSAQKKEEEIPADALSPTLPVRCVSAGTGSEMNEAVEAMLLLGSTTGQKKENGPLKKRTVHTLNNSTNMSMSTSTSSMVPTSASAVQLNDFTGSWQIPLPLNVMNLAQLYNSRLSSDMYRDAFSRSYHSSKILEQCLEREIKARLEGSFRR